MACTGLLLVLFLIAHVTGNFLLFADDNGEAFNAYEKKLTGNAALLFVAEAGLVLLFGAHIALAIGLARDNRDARAVGYRARNAHGGQTFASRTMIVTGLVILLFLVVHLWDFRIGKLSAPGEDEYDLAAMVRDRLSDAGGALIYLGGVVAIGLHLSHGIRSAFQSLGVSHPKLDPLLTVGGRVLAVLIALGFASFPVFYLLFWNGGPQA